MRLVNDRDVAWTGATEDSARERPEKVLLEGRAGSPHNYRLVLMRYDTEFRIPRHRHNFDQVRLTLAGLQTFGRAGRCPEGAIGYFPEGTPYGPQVVSEGALVLNLGFGGAGGFGFVSDAEMAQAMAELGKIGRFAGGMFRSAAGQVMPAVNAIWESVNGKRLTYPKPRYEAPVIMHADAFAWVPARGGNGQVTEKHLGTFSEARISLSYLRLDAGGEIALAGHRLIYALDGAGACDGADFEKGAAVEIGAGETATLTAAAPVRLFCARLPGEGVGRG